jgi:tRNA (uracil-5-)-methyltransferase TRM9
MKKEYAEYLLKKTKEDYNKIAEEFSRTRSQVWEEVRFLFDDYVIPGEKVLDLGCGNGRFFEVLKDKERFFEVLKDKEVDYIGVDFSEKLIEIAKKRFPEAKFQVADALNLPFPNSFFDKVYSIAVFHHIPSKEFRQRFLKEIRRVLKPEGLLILTCWNLWQKSKTKSLIFKFILLKIFGKSKIDFKDILMDWRGIPSCYFHCFTKKELRKAIERVKFKVIEEGEILVGVERKISPKLPNSNFYIIAQKV